MKTFTKIFTLIFGALILFSCSKPDRGSHPVIDLEHHYKMVYMLGGATEHWDSKDPLPMEKTDDPDVFTYEIDLIRSAENKLIKFSVSVAEWYEADFLVPAKVEEGKAYAFLKEGVNELVMTSEKKDGAGNLKDHFFGLDKNCSGKWRLRVNPIKLTLEAEKLTSVPDPEIPEWVEGTMYMVGDATPNGWDIYSPTPMVKPESGSVHTWEGVLKVGEFKIVSEFDWASLTYRPEVNGTEIGEAGLTDSKVIANKEAEEDSKWKVTKAGIYSLSLDIENLTITATWKGEAPAEE